MFVHILAARPNFVKAAPVIQQMIKAGMEFKIVHTGQHYDPIMSDSFLSLLNIPEPDINLGLGSGSHAYQVGQALIKLEEYFLKSKPTGVIVYGDVNATVSAALAAVKLHIPVIHVESGCRSYDRKMPEEINRIITDSISSTLFTTSLDSNTNLEKEGISKDKVFFVGNTMIDSLVTNLDKLDDRKIFNDFNITKNNYLLCTFHRPSNVDDLSSLKKILDIFRPISEKYECILPIHPRTKKNIEKHNITSEFEKVFKIIPPCNYLDFLSLQKHSLGVITDSGGVQEESSYFGKPCFTLRDSTERPVTIAQGTNILVGDSPDNLLDLVLASSKLKLRPIDLWDGKASERLVNILKTIYYNE